MREPIKVNISKGGGDDLSRNADDKLSLLNGINTSGSKKHWCLGDGTHQTRRPKSRSFARVLGANPFSWYFPMLAKTVPIEKDLVLLSKR